LAFALGTVPIDVDGLEAAKAAWNAQTAPLLPIAVAVMKAWLSERIGRPADPFF